MPSPTKSTTSSSTGGFTAAHTRSTPSSSSSVKSSTLSTSSDRSTSPTSFSAASSWATAGTCLPTQKWSQRTGLTRWPRCSPRWPSAPSSSTVPPAPSRRKTASASYLSTSSMRRSTWLPYSVTRFGEILPLWQNFISLWAIWKKLYLVFDNFLACFDKKSYWANFNCLK